MSRTRKYNPDTLAIMDRYFIAVEACVKAKLLKNLTAYCADTGIEKIIFTFNGKTAHEVILRSVGSRR